jgi:hypothetical protein
VKTLMLPRLSGAICSHRFVLNHLQTSQRQGKTRSNPIVHDSSATVWPQPHQKEGGSKTLEAIPLGTTSILMGDTRILLTVPKQTI